MASLSPPVFSDRRGQERGLQRVSQWKGCGITWHEQALHSISADLAYALGGDFGRIITIPYYIFPVCYLLVFAQ